MTSKKAPSFETSLDTLSQLVHKLESGELSLEESLSVFEEGIQLSKNCQKALTEAQQRVEVILKEKGLEATASESES